jgi:hypothetical protein
MTFDRPKWTDQELMQDVIDWIPESKIGVFGYCQSCGIELWDETNLSRVIDFWRLIIKPRYEGGPSPQRVLCEDCGNRMIGLVL